MSTSPYTHPELYKTLVVGGSPSPGKVTLTGHDREHRWEIRAPKGAEGDLVINHGKAMAHFTASFFLADLEDIEAWDDWVRPLSTSAESQSPKALSVYHPDLARNKITDAVVENVGGVSHDPKNGATVTIKFIEYRAKKARPSVVPAASKTVKKIDPNAAIKAKLAALVEQANTP